MAAFYLGVLLEQQGRLDEAEAAYRTGMALGHRGAAYNLLVLLREHGDSEAAYRAGMALGDGRAAYKLGLLLRERGDADEAEAAYRTGIDLGNGRAAHNLGILLREQDRLDEAEAAYRTGVDLGIGGGRHQSRRPAQGAGPARRGRGGVPHRNRPGPRSCCAANLGDLLKQQGRLDEAEAAYRTGIDAGRRWGAAPISGVLLREQNRLDEAEAAYFAPESTWATVRPRPISVNLGQPPNGMEEQ